MIEHARCRNTYKSLSAQPTNMRTVFRVIDVEKDEVVIAPKACAYVAIAILQRDQLMMNTVLPFFWIRKLWNDGSI